MRCSLLRRLEREPATVRALGQGIFDRFCRDMDESMREMGVGDLAVPRKMRRIGEAFYGRQAAYRAALAAADERPLAAALQRNVFAGGSDGAGVRPARGLCAGGRARARRARTDLQRAQLAFPDPEQVLLRA